MDNKFNGAAGTDDVNDPKNWSLGVVPKKGDSYTVPSDVLLKALGYVEPPEAKAKREAKFAAGMVMVEKAGPWVKGWRQKYGQFLIGISSECAVDGGLDPVTAEPVASVEELVRHRVEIDAYWEGVRQRVELKADEPITVGPK